MSRASENLTSGNLGTFFLICLEGNLALNEEPKFWSPCGFHNIWTANIYTSNPDWMLKEHQFRDAKVVTLREAFTLYTDWSTHCEEKQAEVIRKLADSITVPEFRDVVAAIKDATF